MANVDKVNTSTGYRFILKPNCSIDRRQLLYFYLSTCVVAMAVGLFFMSQGIWLILPFSGFEMLVLGLMLYAVFRRSQNREVITIDNASVRIGKGLHNPDQCWEFEKSWIQLHDDLTDDFKPRRKLELGSHGNHVEVGKFLSIFEKDELAFQLKDCIIRA